MGFLDAVGCLRKIKRMAGKEGKYNTPGSPSLKSSFMKTFPNLCSMAGVGKQGHISRE